MLSCALLSSALTSADAQSRTLNWPRIAVTAHLDSTGTLHIRETQHLLFSGSWNGPERRFNIRFGQEFELHRLLRIAGAPSVPDTVLLTEGDLNAVDRFQFSNGSTLRWRSRLPGDAPFDSTALTYVLEYSLSNILKPQGEGVYLLDHDFAFADRDAAIDVFDLVLTLDPAWEAPTDFTGRYTSTGIGPGRSFVVSLPLTWTRADARPSGVFFGAGPGTRLTLALLTLLAAGLLAIRLIVREHALGRFKPLIPPDAIDEEWLAEHLFHQLPEVIGATWDDATSAPEVAATLARLVAEGKLGSRVETTGVSVFRSHILHLELEVDRDSLRGHERALIDALFDPGARTTSTERVRERYKKTGFDPSKIIREHLSKRAAAFDDVDRRDGGAKPKPSWVPTLVLTVAAVASLIAALLLHVSEIMVIILGVAIATFLYAQAMVQAYFWQRRVKDLALHSLRFAIPLAVLLALLVSVLVGVPVPGMEPVRAGVFTFTGLTLLVIAFVNSTLNQAMSRQSPERIALRKRLAAAREYFRVELRNETPALRDAWFPYLIAFGLSAHIDRWFRAFGAAGANAASSAALASVGARGGGSTSASSGSGWTGFGGGGGFAGGGSSASFAAAVGGIAGSVAAPSSGGSGGGGGGGSSGGGGGGGW